MAWEGYMDEVFCAQGRGWIHDRVILDIGCAVERKAGTEALQPKIEGDV